MLANERKPWQPLNLKPRQIGNIEEEDRPTACVGICYYNKLMALEAKEDLASHNLVYKDQGDSGPCDINDTACNEMEEDIIFDEDEESGERRKAAAESDTIYIDDNSEEEAYNGP